MNWGNDGFEIKNFKDNNGKLRSRPQNTEWYFKESISWGLITSAGSSFRLYPNGFIYDVGGMSYFPFEEINKYNLLGSLNSKLISQINNLLNPTINLQIGDVIRLPYLDVKSEELETNVINSISISRQEWDSRETSWDFKQNELIRLHGQDIEEAVDLYKAYWTKKFIELHQNEEELNRQFIEIYGLEEDLDPNVPLEDITILRDELDQKKLKALSASFQSGWQLKEGKWVLESQKNYPPLPFDEKELIKQFISYAVGCMFGRYSLDKPGLILANQGETVEDYWRIVTSGEKRVVSGNANLKNGNHEYKKLQRFNSLAESDGFSRDGISGDKKISERGDVRSSEPTSESGSECSEQYSGRSGSTAQEGIYSISCDSERLSCGSGDTADTGKSTELSEQRETKFTDGGANRSEQNDNNLNEKTKNSELTTHNSSLSNHSPFTPDEDNIIPILDTEWFGDDIVTHFRKFVAAVWGDDVLEENIRFIEDKLGKDLRRYFLRDFYADHIKRYKKRPIYWQFSSPSGAFNVLIYMHRYDQDTLNRILADYLRVLIDKLENHLDHLENIAINGSQREQTQAKKDIDATHKTINELKTYAYDVFFPLATERITIDLDDGVFVNYNKFGKAIKQVSGLNDAKAKKKVKGFDWIDVSEIR